MKTTNETLIMDEQLIDKLKNLGFRINSQMADGSCTYMSRKQGSSTIYAEVDRGTINGDPPDTFFEWFKGY